MKLKSTNILRTYNSCGDMFIDFKYIYQFDRLFRSYK